MDSHSDADHNRHGHSHQKHSSSDLLSSAKLVANAAQSTLRHDSAAKIDKAQVANAAGDLLEAACHYGKLEDKSFGKYIDKAEDYLHKYGAGAGKHHPTATGNSVHPAGGGNLDHTTGAGSHSESHGPDYLKMAQGFLKGDSHSTKPSHAGGGGGEGGYGDYVKLAQDFLKKK